MYMEKLRRKKDRKKKERKKTNVQLFETDDRGGELK